MRTISKCGVVLSLSLALPVSAKPPAAQPTKKSAPKKAPAGIHVRAIDIPRRYVTVEVAGVSKPPAPNLFRFTDERERHYVAMNVACDPPFPSGARMCELEIPQGYERHKLVSLELHLGGLHSRTVAAPESEIAAAWAAAEATRAEPAPSPQPTPMPTPHPTPRPQSHPAPSPRPR